MHIDANLDARCSPERLFAEVVDLTSYPTWLTVVSHVEPVGADVFVVDLRARVGPFARSKRLRMQRTVDEASRAVAFVRNELDGRSHSVWELRAVVEASDTGGKLAMGLHYGGALWIPVLERILRDEIDSARERLRQRVEG